jgi:hypothetical protein
MRKSLLLAVALSCVSASAVQAQAIFDRAWGAKAGVSIASADLGDLDGTFDKSNQTGFAAGLFAHNYWGLFGGQLEASYLQKGASLEGPSVTGSNDYSIDYLELAALLKLGIPLGIVRPGIFGGVGFDIKLSCDEPSGLPDWTCDDVKGTDWAGILGGDVGLYFGSFMIFADARYNIGLSEFTDSSTYTDLKNKGWTVQGGIGFEIN